MHIWTHISTSAYVHSTNLDTHTHVYLYTYNQHTHTHTQHTSTHPQHKYTSAHKTTIQKMFVCKDMHDVCMHLSESRTFISNCLNIIRCMDVAKYKLLILKQIGYRQRERRRE